MTTIRKIKIPKGVSITYQEGTVKVTGPKGGLERAMYFPGIEIVCSQTDCTVTTESERKRLIAMCGTFAAHIKNMSLGVTDGYTYRMKVVYSHFPIQLKQVGARLEINNFLGEKKSRYANIENGVKIALGNDEVTVSGLNKETVGNTAANIEHATHIRNRDPRVFQDGIYLVDRA